MNTHEALPTIVTAGNGRRQNTVQTVLRREVEVSQFDDSCEDALGDVSVIASVKTLLASENWIAAHNDTADTNNAYLLGADIMPYVHVPQESASIALKKPPKNELDTAIATNFDRLLQSRKPGETLCTYRLRSTTSVDHIQGTEITGQQKFGIESHVSLSPDRVAHYATPQGVREYQAAFEAFNEHFPIHKVAGGFCVEVLIAEGAVNELDGVNLYTAPKEDVREAIHGAIYTAISTVSPQALLELAKKLDTAQTPTEVLAEEIYERAWNLPFVTAMAERTFAIFWQKRTQLQAELR